MTTPEPPPHTHSPERGRSPGPPSPGVHHRTPGNTPPPPGSQPPTQGPSSRQTSSSSSSSSRSRHKSKQRERGRKPDPFTNKSQYCIFRQQLYLYIQQNPDIYPYDKDKVQFAIGFFTEGLPSEWAFLFIEKVAIKDKEGKPGPWGTWREFYDELETVFGDSPVEKLGRETPETCHHCQRRFDSQQQKPHTAKWIAQ
jgi:hypothetical protein